MRLPGRQRMRTQFKVCDFVAARERGWEGRGSRCRRGRCEKKLTEDGIGGYHAYIRCTHLRRSSSSTWPKRGERSGPAEEESEVEEREVSEPRVKEAKEKWKKKSPN